jgi:hypothetical protein
MKPLAACLDAFLGLSPLFRKAFRPRTLEGIDRLLFVANGKDRAPCIARAVAGKEVFCQRLDNRPLDRACVLRFVDQDVVDPLVELVVNPCPDTVANQEIRGSGDQILEIEQAPLLLEVCVVVMQASGKRESSLRRPRHPDHFQPVALLRHVAACGGNGIGKLRRSRYHGFGNK